MTDEERIIYNTTQLRSIREGLASTVPYIPPLTADMMLQLIADLKKLSGVNNN